MDYFKKLRDQTQLRIALAMIGLVSAAMATLLLSLNYLALTPALAVTGTVAIALIYALSLWLAKVVNEPTKTVWDAVLHVNPKNHSVSAPNLDSVRLGRELVTNLVLQVYQFASQENSKDLVEHRKSIIQSASIVDHLPLPLFVCNKDLLITNASSTALSYCDIKSSELFGKPIFNSLHLEFPTDNTIEKWMESCQASKVTDTAYWERVHVLSKETGEIIKQCDMAAYYNRDNASGTEFIVTLFDRTERYNTDDEDLGFVALAVHELRTPITMLRGYIDIFEEELGDTLNDELKLFMQKMNIAANRLTAFVGNILNVARIDQNQLELHLTEENWPVLLKECIEDVNVRAKVQNKNIELSIIGEMPTVAADKVSIYEVLNNLLENALKYSGTSQKIIVESKVDDNGLIQTTVQDFGQGIPLSVLPTLFEKFSRNHRTRSQVSGTGLGLYLSKALVTAHGGNIWANSKEGEGSTFGFTLQPYKNLAQELHGQNKEITRSAHGWIKNHSLYRR